MKVIVVDSEGKFITSIAKLTTRDVNAAFAEMAYKGFLSQGVVAWPAGLCTITIPLPEDTPNGS